MDIDLPNINSLTLDQLADWVIEKANEIDEITGEVVYNLWEKMGNILEKKNITQDSLVEKIEEKYREKNIVQSRILEKELEGLFTPQYPSTTQDSSQFKRYNELTPSEKKRIQDILIELSIIDWTPGMITITFVRDAIEALLLDWWKELVEGSELVEEDKEKCLGRGFVPGIDVLYGAFCEVFEHSPTGELSSSARTFVISRIFYSGSGATN